MLRDRAGRAARRRAPAGSAPPAARRASAGPRSRRCSSASCRRVTADRRRAPGRDPARARRAARRPARTARPRRSQAYESVLERGPTNPTALARARDAVRAARPRPRARAPARGARRGRRPSRRRARSCSPASRRCARTAATSTARSPRTPRRSPPIRRTATCSPRWSASATRPSAGRRRCSSTRARSRTSRAAQSRAYRLGDLYSRRGNVQLNFLGQVDAAIASYQKVVEVDSQPAGRGQDPRGAVHAAQRLAAADRRRTRSAPRPSAIRSARPTRCAPPPQLAARARRRRAAVDAAQPQAARRSIRATPAPRPTLERYYEDAQDKSGLVDVLKMRLAARARRRASRVELLKRIARVVRGGRARRRHRDRALPEDPRAPAREPRRARRARPDLRVDRAVGRVHRRHAQADQGHDRSQHEGAALLQVRLGDGGQVRPRAGRDPLLRRGDQDVAVVPARRPRPARSVPPPRGVAARDRDARARGQAVAGRQGARRRVRADRPHLREAARRSPSARCTYYESALAVDPDCLPGEPGAVRALLRPRRVGQGAADRERRSRRRRCATAIRRRAASSIASAASSRG